MHATDYVVFIAYLAGVTALGVHFHKRRGGGEEYYLAGSGMGWFPVGLSVMDLVCAQEPA